MAWKHKNAFLEVSAQGGGASREGASGGGWGASGGGSSGGGVHPEGILDAPLPPWTEWHSLWKHYLPPYSVYGRKVWYFLFPCSFPQWHITRVLQRKQVARRFSWRNARRNNKNWRKGKRKSKRALPLEILTTNLLAHYDAVEQRLKSDTIGMVTVTFTKLKQNINMNMNQKKEI